MVVYFCSTTLQNTVVSRFDFGKSLGDWLGYFPQLSSQQVQTLHNLPDIYRAWNAQINVISRKDEDAIATHHVLHSLAIAKVMTFMPGMRVLDIGTGGGFPAIPLAVMFPEVQWVAVDSIGKKIKVVQDIAVQLGLKNLEVLHNRAEHLSGSFDFAVSRAVARMALLVDWTEVLLSRPSRGPLPNGWLVLKGGDLEGALGEELNEVGRPFDAFPIRSFYDDLFFDQKYVVYMATAHSLAKFKT